MLGAVDLIQPATTPTLFESGPFDLQRTEPAKVVVSAVGAFSCCDIWFSQPDGSGHRFQFNVYGRIGDLRVLLVSVKARDLTLSTDGSREGALAASVRGRPCTAFEIECATEEDLAGVNVFVQAWHADVAMDVTGVDRTVVARQGSPAAQSDRWPVYLSTGSAERGLVNTPLFTRLSDGTAALGSVTNPLATRPARDGAKTYGAASTVVLTGTAAIPNPATTSIAYLWKPSTSAARVEILKIFVSFVGWATQGSITIRGCHITGVNPSPGGSAITPRPFDRADASAATTCQAAATNAPSRDLTGDVFRVLVAGNERGRFVYTPEEYGEAIVLQPSTNEGFEVRTVVDGALDTAMRIAVTFHWIEI